MDNGNPKTWVKFKPSLCDNCWAGCCHGMQVETSIPDMIRLGYLTEDEAARKLKTAAARLKKKGIIRSFRPATMLFVLEQTATGDCIFLDKNRRCTVYEKRPEICRQFPKIGPRPGYCPNQPIR